VCINCTTAAGRVDAVLQRLLCQLCRDPCWIPEYCVRFEVPSAVTVSWDVTPCNLINICQRSEGTCSFVKIVEGGCFETRKKIYQTVSCHIPKEFFLYNCVPWLGRLLADLSPRTPSFNPRPVRAGLWWTKWHWNGFLPLIFRFSRVRIIPVMSHTHSTITDATESSQLTASLNNQHSC
jgi:hypothetical protein